MSRRLIIGFLIVLIVGVVAGGAVLVTNRLQQGATPSASPGASGELSEADKGGQNIVDPTGDGDGDGLPNSEESLWGTDIKNPDTDGDGFLDGEEVKANYNPTIASPNDRLPQGFVPGKDLQPLNTVPTEPIAVDQFFQDNIDLTLGSRNYTKEYKDQFSDDKQTPDTLDSFVKVQPIATQLPAPTNKTIFLQEKDTPNVMSESLEVADSVASTFSNRSIFAEAINNTFGKGDVSTFVSLATIMKLQQDKLIAQRVPPSSLNLYKLLLGYTQVLSSTFDQIARYNEDPVRAVVAMRQWEENDRKFVPLIEQEIVRLKKVSGTPLDEHE